MSRYQLLLIQYLQLLTTLSQRQTSGTVTGEMLVDGKPLNSGFQKGTGFVQQQDNHLPTQTVREAIEFSALLRQPREISKAQKLADVDYIINLLELDDLQDAIIGFPGAGLGVERRKRVTIAVELAAKPELLLFLDEPTSGLDSAGAASIVRLLRKLADDGQAILCTIHQPSALLFESFDNLLLLGMGGTTAYFGRIGEKSGRNSHVVRTYFEQNGAPPCPPTANVAEYILELTAGDRSGKVKWGSRWSSSIQAASAKQAVEEFKAERSKRPVIHNSREEREFSATVWTQISLTTRRLLVDLYRDAAYPYGVLFSNIIVGLVLGLAFQRKQFFILTIRVLLNKFIHRFGEWSD
jgi:ATP-binding cassette subfamily G (WHITE) protein 2 (SNQ2)